MSGEREDNRRGRVKVSAMGATASSAQRDSRDDEDAAAEQRTAETSDAPYDGSADDTVR